MIFDAVGRLAVGQVSTGLIFPLVASAGSYVVTGSAATFRISEAAGAGAYTVTGGASSFNFGLLPGSYVVSGNAAGFALGGAQTGAYIVTGYPATLSRDFVNWVRDSSPSSTWTEDGVPSSSWTPKANPTSTWTPE